MRCGFTKGVVPSSLALLCIQATTLLLSIHDVEAKAQQCRLQKRNQAVLAPAAVSPSSGVSLSSSSLHTSSTPAPTSSRSTSSQSSRTTTSSATGASSPTSAPTPFNYATQKIRGVNLGGWLVLEPWITPSIFENTGNDNIIDEFTLGQMMDPATAQSMLTSHWQTWITEDDFRQISAAGLNHVRIPLGYWSVPLTSADTNTSTSTAPYVTGAWQYLLKGLAWARKYNINVILDIHGAPGSQNGYDNSGQRTSTPVWGVTPDNVTRTVDTLRFLAREIGDQVSVIELLNEGAGFLGSNWAATIRQFFLDGYNAVREQAPSNVQIMIGDAFLGVNSWSGFLTSPQAQGVMMDFHEYQIFSDLELNRSFDDHINFACSYIQSLGAYQSSNVWTIIGEWSNAPTDCAKWLNGRGVGARWDGTWFPGPNSVFHGPCGNYTGSYLGWTNDYMTFLRKYWEVQVEVGESVSGWVFWTWKAENADEWSYQKGLQGGWIPQDPTNRMFPGICS